VAKFRFSLWLWNWLFSLEEFSFEWDAGNSTKSPQTHSITSGEAEQVFTARRFIPLGGQYQPSVEEPRFAVFGETSNGKLLFLAFTFRNQRIRVISARPVKERERRFYAALRQE
jgi:uncharacterized DUF497 family protein